MPHQRRNPASAIALVALFTLAACADRPPTGPDGLRAPTSAALQLSQSSITTFTETYISAGEYTSLALRSDGSVAGWGYNSNGQVTVPETANDSIVAIAGSAYHSLALRSDGVIVGWGADFEGRLTVPAAADDSIVAIAAGYHHSLALRSDGVMVAWGYGEYGQTTVPAAANDSIVAIAGGAYHSLALRSDGAVVAWGYVLGGQTTVPPAASDGIVAIAAGGYHLLALRSDGSVVAWGNNDFGQATVPAAANDSIVAIAGGRYHSVALRSDGVVVVWGDNTYGQRTVPAAANDSIVAIAAGANHSLALRHDGTVVAWGDNKQGQTNVPGGLVARVPAVVSNQPPSASLAITGGVIGAGVTDDTVAVGSRIYFDASASSDADGSIATYAFTVLEDTPPLTSTRTVPTFTRRFDAEGTYTMQVTVTDDDGATAMASRTLVVVPSRAPVAVIANGADVTLREGQALRFLSTGTSDPDPNQTLTYHWDFGDGKTSTLANPNKIFADDGSYLVILTVTDNVGASHADSIAVTVENTSPRATFGAPTTVNEGSAYTLRMTLAADSGAADVAAGLQFAFDCGDGNGYGDYSTTASRACAGAPDEGSRTLNARVRDKDGAETEYTRSLTIGNAPPMPSLSDGGTEAIPQHQPGTPIPFAASFTDPGAGDGPWRLVYFWGDGTRTVRTATTQGMQAEVTHAYAESGTYSVFVQVRDADGAVRNSRAMSVQVGSPVAPPPPPPPSSFPPF